MTKHYAGDDSDVKVLIGGILRRSRRDRRRVRAAQAERFVTTARTRRRPHLPHCGYRPMVELLRYLEANGFTTYIASGGDRDFMRPIADDIYGIPPERVIGSSNALRYDDEDDGASCYWPSRTSSTTVR